MNQRTLLVLAAVAIAGVVAWLAFAREAAPLATERMPNAVVPTLAPTGERADAANVVGDAGAVSVPATTIERSAAAPVTPSTMRRVRGRVVDAVRAPRAGVDLRLRRLEKRGFEVFGDFDPPGVGRGANVETVTSAADGTLTFLLAREGSGTLGLVPDDLVFEGERPRVPPGNDDVDLGDLVVLRACTVRGVVRDQRGQPVADVRVEAFAGVFAFDGRSSTQTAADGTFTVEPLRPGKWTLRTASNRFQPARVELDLQREEQRHDLVIVVQPGQAIAGQVVDDRGVGIAGVRVNVRRREIQGAVDIERMTAAEAATTDEQGFFELRGLTGDLVTVRARSKAHAAATIADVKVGTGDLLVRMPRLGSIAGVLTTATGEPIAGSSISVQSGAAESGPGETFFFDDMGGGANAKTAADGTFRVEGVAPGAALVSARGNGHVPVDRSGVEVLPGLCTEGVQLRAEAGASVRVLVVDEAGAPVANASVTVARADNGGGPDLTFRAEASPAGPLVFHGDGEDRGSNRTGADGIVTVRGLSPGEHTVRATHDQKAPSLPVTVTLARNGSADARVALRDPGHAVVRVVGPDGEPVVGVRVQVVDAARASEQQRARWSGHGGTQLATGEGGVVRFERLVPGAYVAMLHRGPGGARDMEPGVFLMGDTSPIAGTEVEFVVRARETTEVELQKPRLATVRGFVRTADGVMAGGTVELQSADAEGVQPGFGGDTARIGADGSYSFREVPSGRYVARFGKSRQAVKAEAPIDVPAGVPEVVQDLELRTGGLRVQVVGTDGLPLAGAVVELQRGGTAGRQRGGMMISVFATSSHSGDEPEIQSMTFGIPRAVAGADGVAVFEDVPTGTYTVQASHRGHGDQSLAAQTVLERQVTDCGRIELGAAGSIRGEVVGASGKRVPVALVEQRLVGAATWSRPEVAMQGRFTLQGLAPGRYEVRARRADAPAGEFGPVVQVEVGAGEAVPQTLTVPGN
jgi:protocatechuate 3,4-dioxygenase beta subunit